MVEAPSYFSSITRALMGVTDTPLPSQESHGEILPTSGASDLDWNYKGGSDIPQILRV